MIRPVDVAWVAGLLEGEGCFALLKTNTAKINLNMTDRDVVERFAALVGVKVRAVKPEKSHYKIQYRAEVTGSKKAIGWMMTILPLMGARRGAKIKEVIAAWKLTKRRRLVGEKYCVNGHDTTGKLTHNGLCLICKQEYERWRYRNLNPTVYRRTKYSVNLIPPPTEPVNDAQYFDRYQK
jgi:hypothetical protein